MKILFLSRWFPYPPDNGSKLRIYNLLRGLAQYHTLTLLSFVEPSTNSPELGPLQSYCQTVHLVPWKPFNFNPHRALLGLLSLKPRSAKEIFSTQMKERLLQTLKAEKFDLVIASQFETAIYSHYFSHLPALFEEVELGWLYERLIKATSPLERLRHYLTWFKHQRYLRRLLFNFKACTVVSHQEQQLLTRIAPDGQPVEILPNCVNLADYNHINVPVNPKRLIFTGSFSYFPNHEAMTWFVGQVYPSIQAQIPEVELIITGDPAGQPLPPAPNVTLTGFVDDVRPLIAASSVSLAPIWTGGGTRLKILEAMALRTPVVATTKGAEGLEVVHNEHLLIADSPQAFAEAVIRLVQEPGLRQRLTDNAYRLVRQKYDWAAVMPGFLSLVEQVACC